MAVKLKPSQLTKREWKICEAVHLGFDHYFLNGPKDKRPLTEADIVEARDLLSKLPQGWSGEEQPWMVCPNKGRKKHGSRN